MLSVLIYAKLQNNKYMNEELDYNLFIDNLW